MTKSEANGGIVKTERIYVLGSGSIGMALAVHLVNSGRQVMAVRTSSDDVDLQTVEVTVVGSEGRTFKAQVETISLSKLTRIVGTIAVTAKSYANGLITSRLRELEISAPVVILQNGIGVENPYLSLGLPGIYRCVLYVTGQKNEGGSYTFMPINRSPIGVVRGDEKELGHLVDLLGTAEFPFVTQGDIQREVWKKAIINSVFNSICPLLEIDNGIFTRDARAALLAREVVIECVAVMQSQGFNLGVEEVMKQVFTISKGSDGQLISTLQDINHGRETEIDSFNLEIARIGETATPKIDTATTRVLGEMVKIKSMLRKMKWYNEEHGVRQ